MLLVFAGIQLTYSYFSCVTNVSEDYGRMSDLGLVWFAGYSEDSNEYLYTEGNTIEVTTNSTINRGEEIDLLYNDKEVSFGITQYSPERQLINLYNQTVQGLKDVKTELGNAQDELTDLENDLSEATDETVIKTLTKDIETKKSTIKNLEKTIISERAKLLRLAGICKISLAEDFEIETLTTVNYEDLNLGDVNSNGEFDSCSYYLRIWVDAYLIQDETVLNDEDAGDINYGQYFQLVIDENEFDKELKQAVSDKTGTNYTWSNYVYFSTVKYDNDSEKELFSKLKVAQDLPYECFNSDVQIIVNFDAVQSENGAFSLAYKDWKGYSSNWS